MATVGAFVLVIISLKIVIFWRHMKVSNLMFDLADVKRYHAKQIQFHILSWPHNIPNNDKDNVNENRNNIVAF